MSSDETLAGPRAMAAAGLLAGIVGLLILHTAFPFFRVSDELLQRIPLSFPPEELLAEFAVEKQNAALKNAAATGLLLGALAAAAFAATQSLARGSRRWILPLATGILFGAVAGAAAGWLGQIWLVRLLSETEPLTAVVLFQTAFWGILGAGLGAGTGLFASFPGRFFSLLCQGLVAGAVFGLVDATVAAFAFPVDDAEQLVPSSFVNRAIWIVIGITWVGWLLGASTRRQRKPAIA